MLKAVLFDLDDTLLTNDMDRFLPAYLKLLGEFSEERFGRNLVQAVMGGVRVMIENRDPSLRLWDVFWARFEELGGVKADVAVPIFDVFYQERFAGLQPLTTARPEARTLVSQCFERGLSVVIATNPVFPRAAIRARLAWAGLQPEEFPFSLVTTYEEMHSTKPHTAYYAEILRAVGCEPGEALMVGNDVTQDIEPAARLGLHTLLVRSGSATSGASPSSAAPALDGGGLDGGALGLEDVVERIRELR